MMPAAREMTAVGRIGPRPSYKCLRDRHAVAD
jgi:hypothetical protein